MYVSDPYFIDPIGFISLSSLGLNAMLHQKIIFKDPGAFSLWIPFPGPPLKYFNIEEPFHASFLEGMFNSQEHDPDRLDLP